MSGNQGYWNFISRVDDICKQYSEKVAIVYMRNDGSKTNFTFREIKDSVLKAKALFERVGLQNGDRVSIIAPHSPFAIMAGLSLAYSNLTSVLIDASLPKEEVNRLLKFSDVRAVFTTPSLISSINSALIADIPVFNILSFEKSLTLFDDSVKSVSKSKTIDPHDDVIAIFYSSGTTTAMKGIMTTYNTLNNANKLYFINSGLKPDFETLLIFPFSHMAGYSIFKQYFLTGCKIGMIEDVDAQKIAKGLIDFNPTTFGIVPRVYEVIENKIRQEIKNRGVKTENKVLRLLAFSGFLRKHFGINIGKRLFKSINHKVFGNKIFALGTGGSICKESTSVFYQNLGLVWADFYALSETFVPTIGTGTMDCYPIGTVGYVKRHPGIEVKISNPDENGIGEIRIKTVLIMKGYFRDPELTAAAFDEDGYFKTGDLGYIDKKDYLHVTGRIKEAIQLHTGKKVAPSDVDSLYSSICRPDVVLASCGVPNRDESYDEIHLFIEKGDQTLEEQDKIRKRITEFSAQTSTIYQIADIHFIDKLPTTSVGKVKRFKLKEIALSECKIR